MTRINRDTHADLATLTAATVSHLRLTTYADGARVEALVAQTCSCGYVFEGSEANARLFMARCAVRAPHPRIIDEAAPNVLAQIKKPLRQRRRPRKSIWRLRRSELRREGEP